MSVYMVHYVLMGAQRSREVIAKDSTEAVLTVWRSHRLRVDNVTATFLRRA
jgi:hypothetical protein